MSRKLFILCTWNGTEAKFKFSQYEAVIELIHECIRFVNGSWKTAETKRFLMESCMHNAVTRLNSQGVRASVGRPNRQPVTKPSTNSGASSSIDSSASSSGISAALTTAFEFPPLVFPSEVDLLDPTAVETYLGLNGYGGQGFRVVKDIVSDQLIWVRIHRIESYILPKKYKQIILLFSFSKPK